MLRGLRRKLFIWITPERRTALLLAFFGLLSLGVYAWAFVRPANMLEIYRRARPDLYHLTEAGSNMHLALILAFVELGIFYVLAMKLVEGRHGRLVWGVMWAGTLAFAGAMLFLFPFDAADIFDYIIHGRMTGVYGVNPYLNIPKMFAQDPFYPYVAWVKDPSPYGPVWELLAGAGARLAGDGIIAGVMVYKLIPGLFHLAGVALVARALQREAPREALAGTLLLAWNPVVIYETWGNGHNDMVMVFFLIAAAWAMRRQRFTLGVLALVAGTLVKFVPVLLLPAAGLIALRALPDWRARLSFVLRTGALAALLAAGLYAYFWEGPQVLTVLHRTELFTSSIPASIFHLLRPELGQHEAAMIISKGALGLTLLFAVWQGWVAARSQARDRFAHASFVILAFYLLVTILWFQQWYTLWVIGLAPLLRSPRVRALALMIGFAALSKQLVVGPYLFWPQRRFDQPWLEIWFTLGVLGIPWLHALYVLWKERWQKISQIQYGSSTKGLSVDARSKLRADNSKF